MAFTKIAAAGIGSTETVTLHSLEVLNNATVGGVLTYEDVTNVDSIGIVTARAGVLVGSGITLSKDGDIFATGISTISVINSDKISLGDNEFIHIGIGSDLRFSHDSNNSIITNSTGELLINSPIINLRDTSNNSRFRIEPAGNVNIAKNINVSGLTTTGIISAFTNTDGTTDLLTLHADADGTNNGVASIKFTGNTGNHSSYIKGGHTTNGDTILTFHTDTYASGFNPEERVRIDNDGNIGIGTDNPAQAVHINRSSGDSYLRIQGGTNQGTLINKTDGTLIGGFVSGGTVGGSANDIAVRVETGNNIVFAHGTTERLRVDSSGRLLSGHTTSQTIGSNSHGLVQLNVNSNQTVLSLARFENVVAGPSLNLGKSRASSAGSYTVVQDGDGLGSISFSGADGTDLVTVGAIVEAKVDGTPGSNDMPTRLVFSTTKDGESSPSEAMLITSAGYVQDPNLPVASLSSTLEVALGNTVLTSSNFYNVTHVNQGNHFNASTGEFTCPVHGVYRIYFRATTDNDTGNRANVRLQKNGSTINEAYCTQDAYYTNVSSEAVVLCNANDTLRIQANALHTMNGDQHKQVTFQYLG